MGVARVGQSHHSSNAHIACIHPHKALARFLDPAEFLVCDGAGHGIITEAADEVNAALLRNVRRGLGEDVEVKGSEVGESGWDNEAVEEEVLVLGAGEEKDGEDGVGRGQIDVEVGDEDEIVM